MSAYRRRPLVCFAGPLEKSAAIGRRIANRCRSYQQYVWVDWNGDVWFSRMEFPPDVIVIGSYVQAVPRTIAEDIDVAAAEWCKWRKERAA